MKSACHKARNRASQKREPRQRSTKDESVGIDNHPHALQFILRFAIFWLAAMLFVALLPQIEEFAVKATIWSLSVILSALAAEPEISGNRVLLGRVSFEIVAECTSLMPTVVLSSAIIAFPSQWQIKVQGLVLGLVGLWTYNVIRILVLFPVKAMWPSSFNLIHVFLWQTTTMITVVALFLLWCHRNGPRVATSGRKRF